MSQNKLLVFVFIVSGCTFIISQTVPRKRKVKSKEKTEGTFVGTTAKVSNYGTKLQTMNIIRGPHSLFPTLYLASSSSFQRVSSSTFFSPCSLTSSLPCSELGLPVTSRGSTGRTLFTIQLNKFQLYAQPWAG